MTGLLEKIRSIQKEIPFKKDEGIKSNSSPTLEYLYSDRQLESPVKTEQKVKNYLYLLVLNSSPNNRSHIHQHCA